MNSSTLHPRAAAAQRIASALLLATVAATAAAALQPQPVPAEPLSPRKVAPLPYAKLTAFSQEIPTAAYKIDMLLVPGSADGKIKPFFISKTELTWEAFDVYIYRLDEEAGKAPPGAPDAVTRPSKPYLPPDRGFGHEGYPAISMSHKNATEFCKWLTAHSAGTGRTYRLPTEAEWEHAARAGGTARDAQQSDKPAGTAVPEGSSLADCAWSAANAADTPHPVAKKKSNALGLHDMLGNVAEWVDGKDGKPVVKGGSFRDADDKLTVTARTPSDPAWNRSDPQVPKSKWWLADAPFIGFRIVCEVTPPAPDKPAAPAAAPPTVKPAVEPEKKP